MNEYKNVITWKLPKPFVSENTVELITTEEWTMFNEFLLTCISAISAITVMSNF